MTLFHSIVLGIVEGITEFLPVSSTGHLIVVAHLLKIADSDFLKSFEIVIQLGAIAAILVMYIRKLLAHRDLVYKVIVGFIPTGIIGLLLYSFVKQYLLGSNLVVIVSLFIGGIILIVFEYWKKEEGQGTTESLSYRQSFMIGLAQSIAVIPGVSRSAATIVAGRSLNLSRASAVEFSFLLSIPTILAAAGLDLVKHGSSFTQDQVGLVMVGFIVSFIVAWIVSVGFLRFVQKYSFVPFGIYRIVVAIIFFIIFFT